MDTWFTHLHRRDLRFLAFVLANLVCLAGHVFSQGQTAKQESGGWRRIDLDAVKARIATGDLLQQEATWYHNKDEAGRKTVPEAP